MAFWHRIKPSKLKSFSNEFKRCYVQLHGLSVANHSASCAQIGILRKPTLLINRSGFEFPNNVRFFAAPVQAKPKQEEKDNSGPRLNDEITALTVRLVSDDGHTIVSLREALRQAMNLKLDLVEVQRAADPPVCKIMDYHKEKYKKEIKEKDKSKSKSEVTLRKGSFKEVRFSAKTEKKDLQMKADTVKRLMERGYRVKVMATGTEEQDLRGVLARLSALIEDVSMVESGPLHEKKQSYCIVRHIKFGPGKKGSGKKADKALKKAKPALLSDPLTEDDEDHSEAEHDTDDDVCPEEDTHEAPSVDVMLQQPVLDSTATVPSPHSMAPPVIENRYRREPTPPRDTMEHKRMGTRDSMPSSPQSPNQQRELRIPDQRGPSQFSDRQRQQPQFPDQRRQPQFPDQLRQPQVGLTGSPSRVDDSPEKPVNRYSKGNTSNSASPRLRGG